MDDSDVGAFDAFLERNWGIKPPKMPKYEDGDTELETTPVEPIKVPVSNENVSEKQNETVQTSASPVVEKENLDINKNVEKSQDNSAHRVIRRNIGMKKNTNNTSKDDITKNDIGTVGRNSLLNGIDLDDEENDDNK